MSDLRTMPRADGDAGPGSDDAWAPPGDGRGRRGAMLLVGAGGVALALLAGAIWSWPPWTTDPLGAPNGVALVAPAPAAAPLKPADIWATLGGEPAPTTTTPTTITAPTPTTAPTTATGAGSGATTRASAGAGAGTATPTVTPTRVEAAGLTPAPTPELAEPGPARDTALDSVGRSGASIGTSGASPEPADDNAAVPLAPIFGPLPAHGANVIDGRSSTIEGSTGYWKDWFSEAIGSTQADAFTGSYAMRVKVKAPYGWGVELNIWPGFVVRPGPHILGFAARNELGVDAATMTVHWYRGDVELASEKLTIGLTEDWQQAYAYTIAPSGVTHVRIDFRNRSGGPGDRLLLDDIIVAAV